MWLADPLKTAILITSVEHTLQAPGYPPHFSTTMKTTLNTIFSRSNVLNALLALCTAIEFCYDLGASFGCWWRQGGREEVIRAVALIITAIVWTVSTARLGAQVVRTNAPTWFAQLNTVRHQVSRAFSYEYSAS